MILLLEQNFGAFLKRAVSIIHAPPEGGGFQKYPKSRSPEQ